jgi:ribose transport system ATP-binding protein
MCEERLHELMVGRVRAKHYYKEDRQKCTSSEGIAAIEVCNLSGCGVKDVSFALHRGEVLGIGGLLGCGKEDVGQAIIGAAPFPEGGEILVDGRALPIRRRVEAAISAGVGYVPRERRVEGLIPYLPLRWNVSMATLGRLRRLRVPWIDTASESRLVNAQINLLRIKASDPMQLCTHLSGGNQQKVVLGKWLAGAGQIFIFDEPTRGVDVGAKVEIYNLMNRLTARGAGIIMISSELPELLGMSDRIVVMHRGRIHAELAGADATEERVLSAALGLAG